MTADELKASVLQMAIEGRLVPQLDDEPAVDMDVDSPDDVPFDIPEKWKWCYLKEIVELINGDRGVNYPSKDKLLHNNTGNPFISAINLKENKILALFSKKVEMLSSVKSSSHNLPKFHIHKYRCRKFTGSRQNA